MSATNQYLLTATVDEETYEMAVEAASQLNMPVELFVSTAVLEKAETFRREGSRIQVSRVAADRMLEALEKPAEPNNLLQEAIILRQRSLSNGRFSKK